MKRAAAIQKIASLKLTHLKKQEKENYLISWWNIDTEDEAFHSLPETLKKEITENSNYGNPEMAKYNPLILKGIIHGFKGVRNEYLEIEFKQLTNQQVVIKGEVEDFEKCPCCGYKTLTERRAWDICEVCYWEDDIVENLDIESAANRMTLRQAKENFKKIGACEARLLQYTEKELDLKYQK